MSTKQPFSQRIVIAFVLMTVVVSGIFSLSLVVVTEMAEKYFVTGEMEARLSRILRNDIRNGHSPRLDVNDSFYAYDIYSRTAHNPFAEAKDGYSEVRNDNNTFYVYAQTINDRRYLLVKERGRFESHEKVIFAVVVIGFFLTVISAWGIGRAMSRKVMAPIISLAHHVRLLDQQHSATHQLAPNYANDEIGQLAAAFDNTFDRLQQALERERLFTSDISHELRTPLMVISSSCELLAETSANGKQRKQIGRISHASSEMLDLVQTLLQLSRARKIYDGDPFTSVSLTEMAEEQSLLYRHQLKEKGVEFQLIREGSDTGLYNPILLRTVMSNLFRNALHYTDEGSVQLVLETGGFRIVDTGIGIPADLKPQIFQAFIRGSQARGEGLGLGLSLVRRICTHQGWHIDVSDSPPRGCCFHVSLAKTDEENPVEHPDSM